jgi:CPA2 family monovalent cation:H+ antiporter-2
MAAMPGADHALFFRDLAYVFAAAVLGGVGARLLRQPQILGYVVGGILISPLTPGPSVSDIRTFEQFAEIGVILLMFSIGIEFSLQDLVRVRWIALIGGPLGLVLTIALGVGAGALAGWPPLQGAVIGMVVSVASTMVLARLLLDRGELHTRHGRVMIGIVLVEDLAVVVLIVLMPRLGDLGADRLLAIARGLGLAGAILVPFFYLAARVVPGILTRAARLQSPELFLLVALAIALGAAAITQAAGLSLALGAFLAGLLISESDFSHETLARLLPLRDTFVALFFVTVGALIDPRAVLGNLPLLGVIVALVLVGKFAIRALVTLALGEPVATALLVGVGLTQIGEFSFVLVQVARASGLVGPDVYHAVLAASLLTILVNAALMRWVPAWIEGTRLVAPREGAAAAAHAAAAAAHVVLCGFGRIGSAVAEALETFGVRYVPIEIDPDIVRGLRARGVPSLYGDASSRNLLELAGVRRATLVVVTLPEFDRAYLAVRTIREVNPGVPILARAHHTHGRDRLVGAGATEVVQPEFEAAAALIRQALQRLPLPPDRALAYIDRFRRAMEVLPDEGRARGQGLPEVREVVVEGDELVDRSLGEARVRERFGVTVTAVARADGDVVLHPTAETVIRGGDRVRVFGLPEQIEAFAGAAGRGAPAAGDGV